MSIFDSETSSTAFLNKYSVFPEISNEPLFQGSMLLQNKLSNKYTTEQIALALGYTEKLIKLRLKSK